VLLGIAEMEINIANLLHRKPLAKNYNRSHLADQLWRIGAAATVITIPRL
jgi:hypothetical protein